MLRLENVNKDYVSYDQTVHALRNVDIEFRKSEFVAVLGPSGCGKTTMLNIIGGLDRYSDGDLKIDGKSTKGYTSRDWDTYRNHTIGFVFQSYNLIPHQTVLGNVELALTLSGVSKEERKIKATAALEKVGLKTQLNKLPNQLSGGQMQRVAIARAIVNDPEIILADEPTGALDTQTSVQVMDILKEISRERLVIMVTHNPELAEKYSTRIVKLLDGEIEGDSSPYKSPETIEPIVESAIEPVRGAKTPRRASKHQSKKRASMSFFTAISLSLRNLFTKKARTFLTSFAGSIGIIGIALVLSMSSGFQAYIDNVQKETLSTYPVTIEPQTLDIEAIMNSMMNGGGDKKPEYPSGSDAGINGVLSELQKMQQISTNDLESFKKYLDTDEVRGKLKGLVSDVKYSYNIDLNIYKNDYSESGYTKLNPFSYSLGGIIGGGAVGDMFNEQINMMMSSLIVWDEMIENPTLIASQYDLLRGKLPTNENELVVVLDKYNQLDDYSLFALGLLPKEDLLGVMMGTKKPEPVSFDDIMKLEYKLLNAGEGFEKNTSTGVWENKAKDYTYMNGKLDDAKTIKIAGIIRPKKGASATSIKGTVGYLPQLTRSIITANSAANYPIIAEQMADDKINVLTGVAFDEEKRESYDGNMAAFGYADLSKPSKISIYPLGFNEKDSIVNIIEEYNSGVSDDKTIKHTDYIGLMMSSISTIINAITYVLIAFVSISLIVSSIMIGIITYISVLERTKEIGVLRSIGASKRDISNVFNAETLIIGFISGMLGIIVTMLLNIPINIIINSVAQIGTIAVLPWVGGILLVVISMLLTFVSGLIPSRIAAKKDPVVALRSE